MLALNIMTVTITNTIKTSMFTHIPFCTISPPVALNFIRKSFHAFLDDNHIMIVSQKAVSRLFTSGFPAVSCYFVATWCNLI